MIDVALFILHTVLGTFFTITGFRKVFVPKTMERVHGVLTKYNVPKPAAYMVTWGQFLGGLGLITGTLTQLTAALLLPIMFGAMYLSVLPERKELHKDNHWSEWTASVLCTAEAQITTGLIVLALAGGGLYSLDGLIRSWFPMGVWYE